MPQLHNTLSVSEVAALCGFNRNTVGLWIRSKKLRAFRIGKKYAISVEELIYFLQSSGHRVPDELGTNGLKGLRFRSFIKCWEYFQDKVIRDACRECTVYENRLGACFTAKGNPTLHCSGLCEQCDYYANIYAPRLQFLHQIDFPAAVCKDLNFWAGNALWARLSGIPEKDLVGLGIEDVYHPDSLGIVIANQKRRMLGDASAPRTDAILLKNATSPTMAVDISVFPLSEPPGTWLLLADRLASPEGAGR
ncbi:MAG: helix-turn-helix domain-containing protein [Desulfobacterales bacterium]|nr:helix-turn-helix domain-containing protein [Desulfobacterales bacterium]